MLVMPSTVNVTAREGTIQIKSACWGYRTNDTFLALSYYSDIAYFENL